MEPTLTADVINAASVHAEAIEASRMAAQGSIIEVFNDKFSILMSAFGEMRTDVALLKAEQISHGMASDAHFSHINGGLADAQKQINTLVIWKARSEGFVGAINMGWTTIIALIGSAISGIFVYLIFKK